jgi:hypothetical protein
VIVKKEGFELTNGRELIAALPTVNGEYDFKALTEMAVALKREHPETETPDSRDGRDPRYGAAGRGC